MIKVNEIKKQYLKGYSRHKLHGLCLSNTQNLGLAAPSMLITHPRSRHSASNFSIPAHRSPPKDKFLLNITKLRPQSLGTYLSI